MSIQIKFRQFDEKIRLKRFKENAELVQKRDRVLTKIRDGIARQFPSTWTRPTFEHFNQGSYEMGTGVVPVNGDYDIDVGLMFNAKTSEYPNPVALKKLVYDAVEGHTTKANFRRPCLTVYYVEGGQPKFHVDLAVYATDIYGRQCLAVGKQGEQGSWVVSNPRSLSELVERKFSGDDADQFLRVIRYLKRWKDSNFSPEGAAAPTGIALTACALRWFTPSREDAGYGTWGTQPTYDDLAALTTVVAGIRQSFENVVVSGSWEERLRVVLPVEPGNDLFAKMNRPQMAEFKSRLDNLHGTLLMPRNHDEAASCVYLRRVFGDDFPA